ncbi:MAG: prolipoprotein diacylglyceryl transferase [Erysipelotrichaceae bacterium]|nr:prolipoprotein diacylglyceryl transferase [Erysipelotrichaceae bacterium]
MKLFPNDKVWLEIGPLNITYYATLIIIGAVLAYLLTRKNFKDNHKNVDDLSDLFFDVLWIGVIGARLWYCAFYDFVGYFTNPLKLIAVWEGGLAIHGGVIFGIIYAYYYCKRRGWNFLKTADMVVPNILIAQAIGRWGNFINQEAHGKEVGAAFFDGPLSFLKSGMYIDGRYYYPTFFFESIANIIGFVLIVLILKKTTKKRGQLFFSYFMWYGAVRFFIEFYRTDALLIGPLKIAQIISIISLVIGICGYYGLFDKYLVKDKPTIIFDLDGTIIDTEKGIIKSYEYLFSKYDDINNFTAQRRLEVLGPSLFQMFDKYFPNLNHNELLNEYRQHNEKIFKDTNSLMNNAETTIKTLFEQGYNLGIVSTKMHDRIIDNLKLYNLDKYFKGVIGIDDVKNEKPSPEGIYKLLKDNRLYGDDLIYIGDSYNDILCGKNANAYTVGYIFNQQRKDELLTVQPDEVIEDLSVLLEIVNKDTYFTANRN